MSVYLTTPTTIQADFTWNAENRLIAWDPLGQRNGLQRFRYKYDHRGRRVERICEEYDETAQGWLSCGRTRYIWAGWLLVEEIDVDGATLTPSKQFTWGLDLSGALEGAGGVGGLLATRDLQGTTSTADDRSYIHFYDANGNTGQLVDAENTTLSLEARYEYTPYGTLHDSSGTYADQNPWRFSTKQFDIGADLYYYGYRYYQANIGRWLNRDPLHERVFLKTIDLRDNSVSSFLTTRDREPEYTFVQNSPDDNVDLFGLCTVGDTRTSGTYGEMCLWSTDNICISFYWLGHKVCHDCQRCKLRASMSLLGRGKCPITWVTEKKQCGKCVIQGAAAPAPPPCALRPKAPVGNVDAWQHCQGFCTQRTASNCQACCDLMFGTPAGGMGGKLYDVCNTFCLAEYPAQ